MAQFSYLGSMQATWAGPDWLANTNAAQQALASCNSGPTAPSPTYPGMHWLDTGASPPTLRQRNAANSAWAPVLTIDGSTVGLLHGGTPLGSAATRDAGTAATNVVALDASARLPAVDASMLLNLPAANSTGDIKLTLETTAPAGWLFCDGATLGPVTSGATYAATTYQALFTFVWERITASWCQLYTSAGVAIARGASAGADWTAARRIALPDARGSMLLVRDNLGGTTAGRVTASSTGGANAGQMGARGGAEAHVLAAAEVPVIEITATGRAPSDHSGGFGNVECSSSGSTGTVPIATIGGGAAHSTMPPWFSLGLLIKT